jgi:hypothetical protein
MDKNKAQTNQSEDAILMTKAEACTRYSLSLRFLSELIEDQVLPSIKLARKCVRIPIKEADQAIHRYMKGGAS